MLAIARCLMGQPRLIMFDEPSLGLGAAGGRNVFEVIRRLNAEGGLTIMLVEQNVAVSLGLADRGYVLENGRIVIVRRRSEFSRTIACAGPMWGCSGRLAAGPTC